MNDDETRLNDLRFCGGIVVGALTIFVLAGVLNSVSSAVAAHALVLIVAALIVPALSRLSPRGALTAFSWGIASALVVATAAGTWMAIFIARDASKRAAGQPYCLYVSDDHIGYRTARHLLDLSPIRMWAGNDGAVRFQFHAVLLIEASGQPALSNWSYRERQFQTVDSVRNNAAGPLPPCAPKPRFADDLPLL